MITVLSILIFMASSMLCSLIGFNEAILYSGKASNALSEDFFTDNEHVTLRAQDAFICIVIVFYFIAGVSIEGIRDSMIFLISNMVGFVLNFSFFHNWFYYVGRNEIDQKIKSSLTYQSKTSTAKREFNFVQRSIMLILGIIVIIAGNIVIGS